MRGPFTFSAPTSDINDGTNPFQRLIADPDNRVGDQVARFSVLVPGNSGSATLQVALVKNGEVIAYENATCTAASTRRTALGNGSGSYITTVAFTHSGNDKCDLLGMDRSGVATSKVSDNPLAHDDNCEWWFGITGLSTVESATVYYDVSPKV
jgi:hypothetical protein